MKLVIFFIFSFWSITMMYGVTNTWNNNNSDGDWHKPCNWSLASVPTCTVDVIIPTGYVVNITGIAHCKTIALQGTADINILGSAKLEISNSNLCVGTATISSCGPSCGTQVWTSSNLNVGTMINSNPVPPSASQQQLNNGVDEKYCYNNVLANCAIYGGLYEFGELMKYNASVNCDPCGSGGVQGLCPAGYHIPTDLEWSRYEYCIENNILPTGTTPLATFQNNTGYRGSASAGVGPGTKMKVTASDTPSWDGTNTSGFSVLPGGYRNFLDGAFANLGIGTAYRTATEFNSSQAWYRYMFDGQVQSGRQRSDKSLGYYVRCLQN